MLTQYLTEDTFLFADDVSDWREAIEIVAAPLGDSGAIGREYVDAMLESIAAPGGTYIDLGFGIALAHARPERGVVRTALSALRVRPDVLLNDDEAHPIGLFFCLAAADPESHLAAMASLARLLSNEPARSALLAAHDSAGALAVLKTGDEE
jgi:mannitol/fructose-specific phosphotransferase system IIA component (Ntr-type)